MTLKAATLRVVLGLGGFLLVAHTLVAYFGPGMIYVPVIFLFLGLLPVVVPGLLGFWGAWYRFSRDHHLERWQGSYYSFDEHQVRIVEHRGSVWIVLRDALARSKLQVNDDELAALPRGSIGELEEFRERAVTDVALLELLSRRNYAEAIRFRVWLEREVLPPIYRRRTGQKVPYTMGQQVAGGPPPPGDSAS